MTNHPNRSKLTAKQSDLLLTLQGGQWHSAYDLGLSSCAQLERLQEKGYLESKAGLGSVFTPTTAIKWRLNYNGTLAVRAV